MKTMFPLRTGLLRAIGNVWQTLPIVLAAMKTQKKMMLIAGLLSYIFFPAFSQQTTVLMSSYDSCHIHPPRQTAIGRQALSVSSPTVRVAYVIPSNRTAQPDGVVNLQHAIKAGQQFFKEQMEQNGFGAKTYVFETEADGVTPLIHVVQVPETDDFLRGDVWGRAMQSASNAGISLWANGEVWVVVPEAHLMLADGTVTGGSALGASFGTGNSPGVAMIGSNALPLFNPAMITDDTSYDGKVLPAIGPFLMKQDVTFAWFEGTTYSSLASSWTGALVHEMGHAFGLAHDFRNDNNFHGNLMGNGLRGMRGSLFPEKYPQDYTRLEYASALILNVSHYYNSGKSVTSSPVVSYANPASAIPQKGLVRIAFKATDNDSLSLAHLRYDGNTVAEIELEGKTADTAFVVPYFMQGGGTNSYTIAMHDKQGNTSYNDVRFTVPGGYNQAPIPFIRIDPPVPGLNQPVALNATNSSDDQTISSVQVTWDVDNDGRFDTEPSTNKTLQYRYENAGNYLIRVKLTDPSGAQTTSTAVSIKIPGEKKIAVESFTLLNAEQDAAVATLKEGMEINLLPWEGKTFSIRANTSPGVIVRVEFDLKGPIIHQQTDNEQPYALFGDSPQGNFTGRKLLPGEYTLTATPFYPSGKGIARIVSFRVIDKSDPGQATIVKDKTIGGIEAEYLRSAIATADGGYLLAGSSSSNTSADKSENSRGASDYWIVKIDAQHNKVWDKTYGGEKVDELRSAIPTNDGGYLLAGYSESNGTGDKSENSKGYFDYWVIKIDNQGNKVWDKTFGGMETDYLFSAIAIPGEGYLLAGSSSSDAWGDKSENNRGPGWVDYWIVRIDEQGNKIWDKTFGGNKGDWLQSAIAIPREGFMLGGFSDSNIAGDKSENSNGPKDDYWVVKIDNQGNKIWDKTIGGSDSDVLQNVILTSDKGYLLSGNSTSDASVDKSEDRKGVWDIWVIKIDALGNKVWDKTFGGDSNDQVISAISTPDRGYLLAGSSSSSASGDKSEISNGTSEDYWVVKIDNQGNKLWDKTIGGNSNEWLSSCILAHHGNYLLAGTSGSNASGDKTENSKGGCDQNGEFCSGDYWIVELKAPRLPIVTSLTLMNAHTSQEIKDLNSGDAIHLGEIGDIWLDIRANITADKLSKVTFDLTGPITQHHTETVAPYALFGDIQGDFNGRRLLPGMYSLTVTAYASDTEKGSRTVAFTVIERVNPVVTSLTLMNAHTSQEVKELKNRDVINLTEVGRLLDIRANTTGDNINKVTFDLTGPITQRHTEMVAPYALFGDIQGDFNGRNLLAGAYNLTVTAYASDTKKGILIVSFTVVDRVTPAVASLTLMNAHTSQEIKELKDGDVIRLTEVGELLDVRANITDQRVNKVTFDLNGPITVHQTETVSPYALFGDIQGDFNGRKLSTGSYILTVTPYAGDVKGTPHTIAFTVTREVSAARSMPVEVYPIPASKVINIKHEEITRQASMTFLDVNGNVLLHRPLGQQSVEQLDVSTFRKGIYYIKIISPEELKIIRVVVE